MAKAKYVVEINPVAPLPDRLITQHIDYISQPGRHITTDKMNTMDTIMEGVAGLVGNALGLNVVNVNSERH